jgi:hypothetical protein
LKQRDPLLMNELSRILPILFANQWNISIAYIFQIWINSTSTKRICLISFVSQQVGLFLLSLVSLKVPYLSPFSPNQLLRIQLFVRFSIPTPNTFSILNKNDIFIKWIVSSSYNKWGYGLSKPFIWEHRLILIQKWRPLVHCISLWVKGEQSLRKIIS